MTPLRMVHPVKRLYEAFIVFFAGKNCRCRHLFYRKIYVEQRVIQCAGYPFAFKFGMIFDAFKLQMIGFSDNLAKITFLRSNIVQWRTIMKSSEVARYYLIFIFAHARGKHQSR